MFLMTVLSKLKIFQWILRNLKHRLLIYHPHLNLLFNLLRINNKNNLNHRHSLNLIIRTFKRTIKQFNNNNKNLNHPLQVSIHLIPVLNFLSLNLNKKINQKIPWTITILDEVPKRIHMMFLNKRMYL